MAQPGGTRLLPAGQGRVRDVFRLLKGRLAMRNTDHLTREQLRELMRKPVSPSIAERRRKADEDARWLLALNLNEMEEDGQIVRAKKSDGDDKGLHK